MHHDHSHHHHVHTATSEQMSRTLLLCIALNLVFVAVEAVAGWVCGSLGLLSDAGHNLSDVFSLVLAWTAYRLARLQPTRHFTYGYKKTTVLVSLVNAVVLLVAVGGILVEALYKLRHPSDVSGAVISWTAGVGIVVNGFTAWLLMRRRGHDLNARGAYLHMVMDTLVSVGVVISGIVIALTGWVVIDTLISLAIVIIIIVSTWGLLRESLRLSIDAVPESLNIEEVEAAIRQVDGVADFHHFHIWAVSTTENAATLHVVVPSWEVMEATKAGVKASLARCGITHATVECELPDSPCHAHTCRP